MPEVAATDLLGYLLLCFMIGRYVGTFLMRTIKAETLLTIYSAINILLLAYITFIGGRPGVYSMMGVEFFMSIMFPTIFALGIKDLGAETKIASSYMVMAIVGGATIPLVLGYIARHYNMQLAYIVPLICFFFILFYGAKGHKIRSGSLTDKKYNTAVQ